MQVTKQVDGRWPILEGHPKLAPPPERAGGLQPTPGLS